MRNLRIFSLLFVLLAGLSVGVSAAEPAKEAAAKPAAAQVEAVGKVNLNTASINELTALKGIGEKKAQAIVDYREKQGKFTTVDQLADVSGIGPATLEANRDMIIVK